MTNSPAPRSLWWLLIVLALLRTLSVTGVTGEHMTVFCWKVKGSERTVQWHDGSTGYVPLEPSAGFKDVFSAWASIRSKYPNAKSMYFVPQYPGNDPSAETSKLSDSEAAAVIDLAKHDGVKLMLLGGGRATEAEKRQ